MIDMKPIHFPPPVADEMVRAILEDRKTATRRVVKPQPKGWSDDLIIHSIGGGHITGTWMPSEDLADLKLPCLPGDILYVRETWCRFDCSCCEGDTITGECLADNGPDEKNGCWMYRASNIITGDARWRPSIHMPREAARIFLRVTDVRVERLQDITEAQAAAEGAIDDRHFIHSYDNEYEMLHSAREHFAEIWGGTIKPAARSFYGWEANPYVWVIEFEKIR